MTKQIKAGSRGEVTKYISRAKVLRKLQLSLKDFRRICILKGVYPREAPRKLAKSGKTFYHVKDISWISHERILNKFRDLKSHLRKI